MRSVFTLIYFQSLVMDDLLVNLLLQWALASSAGELKQT